MTKKSNLLIISLLLTISVFIYLTIHHFSLKLGLTGNSLCEISSHVNCDAAATSNFSELLGIPIAILGGVFHLILLSFVLFYRLNWVDASSYLQNTIRALLVSSVAVSLVAASYSLFILKVICPFCVASYVFSFINLFLGWSLIQDFSDDFKIENYLTEYRSHIFALISIPLFSWLTSEMIQSNYGLDLLKKQIPEKLAIWNASPKNEFDNSTGLSNGVKNPRVTLVEFADFKCPHCRVAAKTIETFLKGRSDILFIYKPFPLDGNCNDGIPQKGDNSRCTLAAFTLCAEKIEKKGWQMHHWIFEKQEQIFSLSDVKTLLPEIQAELGLDSARMAECADSSEIYSEIKKNAQEGSFAKVEGTPTIYMNGRKLPLGQYLEVLKQASEQ